MLTRESSVRIPVAPSPSTNNTTAPPPRPTPLPSALARPFTFAQGVQALRRQWVLALSAALAGGTVVGCIAFALLPAAKFSAYTALATLQVSVAPPTIIGQPSAPTDPATFRETIQARVKSRVVLDNVLQQPEVKELTFLADKPDPYEFLQTELVVDWNAGSEVLSIKMSGDRPKELALLVNAVADAALDDINGRDIRARQYQLEQLTKIHKEYEAALGPRQKELKDLAKGTGREPGDRAMRQMFATMALHARQADLLKIQSEERNAEALLRVPAAARPNAPAAKPAEPRVSFDELMRTDPVVQPILAEIADLNGKIARYTVLYKDNPTQGKQVIDDMGLQKQIDSLYVLARYQYEKKLQALGGRPTTETVRPEISRTDELKLRVAVYEADEEALAKEIKKLEEELHGLEVRSGEIDAIKREIQVREDVSKNVATVLEKLRLDLSALPRAARLEEAVVSMVRGDERRVKYAGLAGLGGAALALFGVGFLEIRRRKLHTIRDVAQGLELPVIGTQPRLPPSLNPLDLGHASSPGPVPWFTLPNDSLDATRVLMMQGAPQSAPRVVVVVSAVGGEGSSVLAAHLAASLARAGRRTLLVDANLRPAVHAAFGVAAAPGLAEALRDDKTAIQSTPIECLSVLTAGAADTRSLQALSRDEVRTFLEQLKEDYDWVVIDAAPVMPCADALLLAQNADVAVLSVLGGVSEAPATYAAWQRLSALGVNVLGIVVQGADDDGACQRRYWFRR